MSRKGRDFLLLKDTLKATHSHNAFLKDRISYKRLARRVGLMKPKLGIGKARKRVDICSQCSMWDNLIKVEHRIFWKDLRTHFDGLCPNYLARFKNICEIEDWSFTAPPFEDQHFWKAFHDYLSDDDARSVDAVELGAEATQALECLAANILIDIGKKYMNRFFSVVTSSCETTASASYIRS